MAPNNGTITSILKPSSSKATGSPPKDSQKTRKQKQITTFASSRKEKEKSSQLEDTTSTKKSSLLGKRIASPSKASDSPKTNKHTEMDPSNRYSALVFDEDDEHNKSETQKTSMQKKSGKSSLQHAILKDTSITDQTAPKKRDNNPPATKNTEEDIDQPATKVIARSHSPRNNRIEPSNPVTTSSNKEYPLDPLTEDTAKAQSLDANAHDSCPQKTPEKPGSDYASTNAPTNPYKKLPSLPYATSEAATQRRAAAGKRKEEIYQQTLRNSQESLNEYTSYKAARGGPKEDEGDLDPSLEMRQEHRSQQSVKFSSPGEVVLKDNQSRPFIHRFDLRVEVKTTDSEEDCQKLLQK